MKTKKILLLILFAVFLGTLSAQNILVQADSAYVHKQYFKSIQLYEKGVKEIADPTLKNLISFRIGDCYRRVNNYDIAIVWFSQAISEGFNNPEAYLFYGDVLLKAGRYTEALAAFNDYNKYVPENSEVVSKIRNAKFAIRNSSRRSLNIVLNQSSVNTPFSDYSPYLLGKSLVFASSRKDSSRKKVDNRTAEGFSDLYIAKYDSINQRWINPEKLKSSINTKKFNDGTMAFDSASHVVYVMQCDGRKGNCNIYEIGYKDQKWGKKESFNLNNKVYSVGHPSLSSDGKTMVFVSDMPGGFGGKDIWLTRKTPDGSWGAPLNAGDFINSKKDEMFPYLWADTLLFFSSDGKEGMGSLDIFCSRFVNNQFNESFNIGYPLNSGADDFGIVLKPKGKGGYFSSNRPGGVGNDDIFSFTRFPYALRIECKVYDNDSKMPLKNAQVIFQPERGVLDTVYTDDEGMYYYASLVPEMNYIVKVRRDGYYDDQKLLTTKGTGYFKNFNKDNGDDYDFPLTEKSRYKLSISGVIRNRETGFPMQNEKVFILGPNNYSDYVYSDTAGRYSFDYLKNKESYTVKVVKKGFFSESRSIVMPDINSSKVFCKSTGFDFDFDLTEIVIQKDFVINNIYYEFDKANLLDSSKLELNKIASMLKETPNITIALGAHTDERGNEDYNLNLSFQRASSVGNYLAENGVDKKRLIAIGYGASKPIVKNAKTEEEHQKNRRTTFTVLKIDNSIPSSTDISTTEDSKLVYKILVYASKVAAPSNKYFDKITRNFPELTVLSEKGTDKVIRYYVATFDELNEAEKLRDQLRLVGWNDCFIEPFFNGQRITLFEALKIQKKI
ncbi:MAG: OmpA family protein [Bacteroidota bacterium]